MGNGLREVVLVFVAAGIGFGGAYLGSHATIVTQRDQASAERQAEARTNRAKVYSAYLDAAVSYGAATRRIQATIRAEKGYKPGAPFSLCTTRTARRCIYVKNELRDYLSDQSSFQSALNDVYVYGSTSAIKVARQLAGALPPSLYNPKSFIVGKVKEKRLAQTYNAMLDTMCREVGTDPRPAC